MWKHVNEIKEVLRMVRYKYERARPLRVTLCSQAATEEILERMFRLRGNDGFKNVYIKKSLKEEERLRFNELQQEAQVKNYK